MKCRRRAGCESQLFFNPYFDLHVYVSVFVLNLSSLHCEAQWTSVQLATNCSLHISQATKRHLGPLQLHELRRTLSLNTSSAMQNQLNEGFLSQFETEEINK